MELEDAVRGYSALSTPSRVNVLRLLAKAGKKGLASGDLARQLGVAANTLSTQLFLLSTARLVKHERDGRNIIYRIDPDGIKDLIGFLGQECAGGRVKATVKING